MPDIFNKKMRGSGVRVEDTSIAKLFNLNRDEDWMQKHTDNLKKRTRTEEGATAMAAMVWMNLHQRHPEVEKDLADHAGYRAAVTDIALMSLHLGYLLGVQETEDKGGAE